MIFDGDLLGTVERSPWDLWWALTPGAHELTAEAILADGTTQITDPLPFSVNSFAEPDSRTEAGS